MNLDIPPDLLTFGIGTIFSAGGLVAWLRHRKENDKTVNEEQNETITDILKRLSALETRTANHERFLNQMDDRLKEQKDIHREVARSVQSLERIVSKLDGMMEMVTKGN